MSMLPPDILAIVFEYFDHPTGWRDWPAIYRVCREWRWVARWILRADRLPPHIAFSSAAMINLHHRAPDRVTIWQLARISCGGGITASLADVADRIVWSEELAVDLLQSCILYSRFATALLVIKCIAAQLTAAAATRAIARSADYVSNSSGMIWLNDYSSNMFIGTINTQFAGVLFRGLAHSQVAVSAAQHLALPRASLLASIIMAAHGVPEGLIRQVAPWPPVAYGTIREKILRTRIEDPASVIVLRDEATRIMGSVARVKVYDSIFP